MLRTGILIVTHNSVNHIGACLDALDSIRDVSDPVLVIDNASDDGTAETVAVHRSKTQLVRNRENAGFAGAVNQGFKILGDQVDAVLLLNPDVILQTSIDELKAACRASGLAGGRLTDLEGNTQVGFSFRRFPNPLVLFLETVGVNRLWKSNPVNRAYRCLNVDHEAPGSVDQPAGAMLMVRKDVWIQLKGLDEQFHPVWFEDVDFCRRAALAGFRASYVPSVIGRHEGGHSVLQIPDLSRRLYWYASLGRYSRKHFGRAGWGMVACGVAAAKAVRSVGSVLRWHPGSVREANREGMIARTAYVYPAVEPAPQNLKLEVSAEAANSCSRVSLEGIPSTENTERTLKRLHAR